MTARQTVYEAYAASERAVPPRSHIEPTQAPAAMGMTLPSSALLALFFSVLLCTAFAISSERFQHWFLIPVCVCGVLAGTDAIEWLRCNLDLYDAVGILGVFCFHFFCLAPILHIQWQQFSRVTPPPDWRDWLGRMAILNAFGLIAYRVCRNAFDRRSPGTAKTYWAIDLPKMQLLAPAFLVITAAAQLWIYAKFGGISGYMDTRLNNTNALEGLGWVAMLGESLPIVIAFIGVVYARRRNVTWAQIGWALVFMLPVLLVFGGLRGSRSEIISSLFWIVGAIHLLVRPVPRKLLYLGGVFVFLFMYVYGFYKDAGQRGAAAAFSGSQQRQQMSQKTGRTFSTLILEDLGRAGDQAYILYRLETDKRIFQYAWGRTYIGALSMLIPRAIMPDRPETKVKYGTELEAGTGSYLRNVWHSSKVYGLGGEVMMNFGPFAVPIAYGLFGFLVAWFRRAANRLAPGDLRLFLVPFGIYTLCMTALAGDSDNFVWALVKGGFVPALFVFLCSTRIRQYRTSHFPAHAAVHHI